MSVNCLICGCKLFTPKNHKDKITKNLYATHTIIGRSHISRHHFVAERFFGKSRYGKVRKPILKESSYLAQYLGRTGDFCFECHEELLHNPVFLPEDIEMLNKLVKAKGLDETQKPKNNDLLAERIALLHKVIQVGLMELLKNEKIKP